MKRREVLRSILVSPIVAATPGIAGCEDTLVGSASEDGDCLRTNEDIEGPFYSANPPTKMVLAEADEPGARILMTGRVLDSADCATGLGGYLVDLWQADDAGAYDNEGFKLRGQFAAGSDGGFTIDTIMPGSYPGRPERHIHVKIRRPDGSEVLTTQIYFEGDANLSANNTGPRARLVDGAGQLNFVVDA